MTNRQLGEVMPDAWAEAKAAKTGIVCRSAAAKPSGGCSQAAA